MASPLAGDRLIGDAYEPIPVLEAGDGALQGYSDALDLYLRWDRSELLWYDPATSAPILSYHDQRDRADNAEARADDAEARADAELSARLLAEARADAAEARLRELEGR